MIRAPRLVLSRPMYAFNPDTWQDTGHGWYRVQAAWFRRKNGRIVATIGTYDPMVLDRPNQPTDGCYGTWIAAADDNRYGGQWLAKWDGDGLLCYDPPVTPRQAAERTAFLEAMLAGFPDPPAGFDGWWTFPKPQ